MKPLATARTLRLLQLATIVLAVAGNLSYSLLRWFDAVSSDPWVVLPFAFIAAALFAVLCVSVQRAAHDLGGPPAVSNPVTAALFCSLLGWIGVPLTLYRTAQAVAVAVDDDAIRRRGLVLAWAIGLGPIPVGVVGAVLGIYVLAPLFSVVLLAMATQLIATPLIEELRARAPQGGVDGTTTTAAVRSV